MLHVVVFAGMHIQKDQSHPQTSSGVYRFQYNMCDTESSPCWGGFGSGTETTGLDVFKYHPFPKPAFVDSCPSDIKETSPLYELSVC